MSGDSEVENVHVFVRIRPLNKREIELGYEKITSVDDIQQQIVIKKPDLQTDIQKTYTFDYILTEDSCQTDVYYRTSHAVVDKVLQGYNGTIFAYGQTGTGKTYTMSGLRNNKDKGIMPNTFAHIFNHISNSKSELNFLVHVTYLEIYNESVRDLLTKFTKKPATLEVREHCEFGVFVENLSGYVVHTLEELERLLDIGDKNRVIGATNMNFTSSRSHTIFTITIESNDKDNKEKKFIRGKLHLVDLAGSERQSKSFASGIRLKEATKINQSLLVLGNVISSLVDGKSNHIPYRNSKLTRLLQDSLGGNSKTVMIATISPSENDYEETISSLRYANRAKNIQNRTFVNGQAKDTLLRSFQTEIEELRKQLETLTSDFIVEPSLPPEEQKKKDRPRKTSKKKSTSELSEQSDPLDEITVEDVTEEIFKAREESQKLREKLKRLKNKILIGGQNLENKNENLLKSAKSKIDSSMKRQEELRQCLKQCEEQRISIVEKYSSAQEEVAMKTKELKKLNSYINSAKLELAELQQEQQEEIEIVLDSVKEMNREMQLNELLINAYIPPVYQDLIKQNIKWNEDTGEYNLKYVAYAGNNYRKQSNNSELKNKKLHSNKLNPYRHYKKPRKSSIYLADTPLKLPNIFEKSTF